MVLHFVSFFPLCLLLITLNEAIKPLDASGLLSVKEHEEEKDTIKDREREKKNN